MPEKVLNWSEYRDIFVQASRINGGVHFWLQHADTLARAEQEYGVPPEIMGIGPVEAVPRVMATSGLSLAQMDVIELNEAFAAQGLATLRLLGVADDAGHVNPNGGAIALGHPLGMSGARLVTTAARQLRRTGGRYGLCTMCIGVGQGIAMIIERV